MFAHSDYGSSQVHSWVLHRTDNPITPINWCCVATPCKLEEIPAVDAIVISVSIMMFSNTMLFLFIFYFLSITIMTSRSTFFGGKDWLWIGYHSSYSTDSNTITYLSQKYSPHVFMPLGNKDYLLSLGIPESHVHLSDWWQETLFKLSIPSSSSVMATSNNTVDSNTKEPSPPGSSEPDKSELIQASFKLTSTPCQHLANRGFSSFLLRTRSKKTP